jgi:hypothetical protein
MFLLLSANAFAKSPSNQLKKLAEQFKKTPTDDVLRKKIIKLAKKISYFQAYRLRPNVIW